MAAFNPSHLTLTITLKHYLRLLCPGKRGAVARIEKRHCRPLAPVDQPLKDCGRKRGQAQLPTDVLLRQPHYYGKVTSLAKLSHLHPSPPAPGPTDRAQDVGVLCLVLAGR